MVKTNRRDRANYFLVRSCLRAANLCAFLIGNSTPARSISQLLVVPNRLACFPLRLFSSYSDVLELAIIHLHQLSPLSVALSAQCVGRSAPMENLQKRNWRRSFISGMQASGDCGPGLGHLIPSFTGFYGTPISLSFAAHSVFLIWLC